MSIICQNALDCVSIIWSCHCWTSTVQGQLHTRSRARVMRMLRQVLAAATPWPAQTKGEEKRGERRRGRGKGGIGNCPNVGVSLVGQWIGISCMVMNIFCDFLHSFNLSTSVKRLEIFHSRFLLVSVMISGSTFQVFLICKRNDHSYGAKKIRYV